MLGVADNLEALVVVNIVVVEKLLVGERFLVLFDVSFIFADLSSVTLILVILILVLLSICVSVVTFVLDIHVVERVLTSRRIFGLVIAATNLGFPEESGSLRCSLWFRLLFVLKLFNCSRNS